MSTIQTFDYSVDLMQALLWQHNDAERLQKLIEQKQAWYDANQEAFWDSWVVDVFDLRTANDFGLSVWSIILNQPLVVDAGSDSPDKPIFGFGEYHKNFNRGNFAKSGGSIGLSTEQKRMILQLRYFQLVSRGAIPEVNAFLASIFEEMGSVYVTDGYDMTASYIFDFEPSSQLMLILEKFDLLPRPAGVELNILRTAGNSFGFGEFHSNFTNGNFAGA